MTTSDDPLTAPGGSPSTSSSGLAGRTALVTGAAGDIGRAVACRLAAAGCAVVLTDLERSAEGLAATVERCRALAPTAEPVVRTFDVTDPAAVARAVQDLQSAGLVADLVFNNAGYQGQIRNVVDYDIDDFRRVMDINVTGVFTVLRTCARALIAAGRPGSIVNTASMAFTGAPNMAAYSASKAAVIGLTKTAAKDLAPVSIRVNSISPAFIGPGAMWERQVELQAAARSQYYSDDPSEVAGQMIASVPMRRYGTLDEVAASALFLLSDEASYITGFNIEVSGGAA